MYAGHELKSTGLNFVRVPGAQSAKIETMIVSGSDMFTCNNPSLVSPSFPLVGRIPGTKLQEASSN